MMVCIPKPNKLPCIKIEDGTQLKLLHSTLYKYGNTQFVCDKGAPTVGGWLVHNNGRMEYMTEDKFKLLYDLLPAV